jgi:hypothetical protein
MIQPDEEILSAILNLRGDPRWEKVLTWFDASLSYAEKALVENTVFNAGRVAELADLEEKIDTAREVLDQIKTGRAIDLNK